MTLIPRDFKIALDPKRPRLSIKDLLAILDLIIAPQSKMILRYQSGLCGAGARYYIHITLCWNDDAAKSYNLAFFVKDKSITNAMACVTPRPLEWTIDDNPSYNGPVMDWPIAKWQALTALLKVDTLETKTEKPKKKK